MGRIIDHHPENIVFTSEREDYRVRRCNHSEQRLSGCSPALIT
jgi:hypothetical protein